MGLIKRTPADAAFSDCVRALAKWRCEVCNTQYPEKAAGLHCSHFHGRGHWGTRFDPDNCSAKCFGCHQKMESSPHDFTRWMEKRLGDGRYQILLERKNDTGLGKLYRKTKGKGEIAKHFREQLDLIKNGQEYIEPFL